MGLQIFKYILNPKAAFYFELIFFKTFVSKVPKIIEKISLTRKEIWKLIIVIGDDPWTILDITHCSFSISDISEIHTINN